MFLFCRIPGISYHFQKSQAEFRSGTDIRVIYLCIRPKEGIQWGAGIISILGGILLIILFWNRSLKKEISARQQTEQNLRESKNAYRSLSDAAFEGIVLLNEGIIIDVNQTMTRIFGYTSSDVLKRKHITALIASEHREEVRDKLTKQYEEPYEINGLKKDGTIFPIEAHGKMSSFEGRRIRVTAIRDLTEKKKAENEIRILQGIIPICMHCKGIRDDQGYWNQLEQYIADHSDVQFSHGICETCLEKYYPELQK